MKYRSRPRVERSHKEEKIKVTPEIAEICGAIIGDGWIESTERGLYVAGHSIEDREYYGIYLAPLFSRTFINVNPKPYHYWSVYGFHTYKHKVIKKIIQLGIQKGNKANNVELLKWIFSSRKLMIAVLRGLFDTDGNFYCKKCYGKYDNKFRKKYHCQPRLRIDSTSKKLILQIYKIFKQLDLHPEKVKARKGGFMCGRHNKERYLIRLNRLHEIKKWFEILNLSSNPKHITKYDIWKKFGFCPANTTLEERKRILNWKISPYKYYK